MAAGKRESDARLRAIDWEDAALDALAEGGLAAVAVEPLARKLNVTKGSFYWHFPDRDALLRAALARWEESYTDRVLAALAGVVDPRERLKKLLVGVVSSKRAWRVHVALGAAHDEPSVAQSIARVTRKRVAYVEDAYAELGLPRKVARRRALLAYATYVGLIHLRLEAARELPSGAELESFLDDVVETLVPR